MPDINLLASSNPHQVRNFCNHPPNDGSVFRDTYRVQLSETESFNDKFLLLVETDGTPVVLNLQLPCNGFLLRRHKLPQNLFQRFLAKPRNFLRIFQTAKSLERRFDDVVRVGRSNRLRQDVLKHRRPA